MKHTGNGIRGIRSDSFRTRTPGTTTESRRRRKCDPEIRLCGCSTKEQNLREIKNDRRVPKDQRVDFNVVLRISKYFTQLRNRVAGRKTNSLEVAIHFAVTHPV